METLRRNSPLTSCCLLWTLALLSGHANPAPLPQALSSLPDRSTLVPQRAHAQEVEEIVAAPELGLFASRDAFGEVKIWDARARLLLKTLKLPHVSRMTLAPTRPLLLTVDGFPDRNDSVAVWDLSNGELMLRCDVAKEAPPDSRITALAISSDGNTAACLLEPGADLSAVPMAPTLFVFEVASAKVLARCAVNSEEAYTGKASVAFSPDNRAVFAAKEDTLLRFDVLSNRTVLLQKAKGKYTRLTKIAVIPDSALLAMLEESSESDPEKPEQRISIFDPDKKRALRYLTSKAAIFDLAVSPGDAQLFAATSRGIAAWNTKTWQRSPGFQTPIREIPHFAALHGGLVCAAKSGSFSSTIWLTDAARGSVLFSWEQSQTFINKMLFSRDGSRLWIRDSLFCEVRLRPGVSAPIWGGPATAEMVRINSTYGLETRLLDITVPAQGEPIALLARRPSVFEKELVMSDGARETRLKGAADAIRGLLSDDGSFSFVDALEGGFDLFRNADGGKLRHFKDCRPFAEDHSARKDPTVLVQAGPFTSELTCYNVKSGERLWRLPAELNVVLAVGGKYLTIFFYDRKQIAIVNLQETEAPAIIPTPELAEIEGNGFDEAAILGKYLFVKTSGKEFSYDLEHAKAAPGLDKSKLVAPAPIPTLSYFPLRVESATCTGAGIGARKTEDETIEFFRTAEGKTVATLAWKHDWSSDSWLITLPAGRYAASRFLAIPPAALVSGLQPLPFTEFDLEQNRPDLVYEALGSAGPDEIEAFKEAHRRRLARVQKTSAPASSFFALTNRLSLRAIPVATTNTALRLPIQDTANLSVWLNDKKRPVTQELVELENGFNSIVVQPDTGPKQHFILDYVGPEKSRDLFLVCIGVSSYKDESRNLRYAAKDAVELEHFWLRHGRFTPSGRPANITRLQEQYGFENIRSLVFTNSQVTRELIEPVRNFIAAARPTDQVIILFAGHGLRQKNGDYYFATHDIDFRNPAARGIPGAAFHHLLADAPTQDILLFLDTCHAGEGDLPRTRVAPVENVSLLPTASRGFDAADSAVEPVRLEELFADLSFQNGGGILAASGPYDAAFESPQWSNGVFTYALLQGLESGKADANRDTKVTFAELSDYVSHQVRSLTGGRQRPMVTRDTAFKGLDVVAYPTVKLFDPAPEDLP